jgi:hypothetical protein
VLQWWGAAAEPLRAFSFRGALHLEPRHLEAGYAVRRARQAGALSAAEALPRLERSPSWGGTARDPQSTRLVVVEVGSRPLALAQRVVPQVTEVVAPGCGPLVLTAGLKAYATALRTPFGQWRPPAQRQERGPRPKPRWIPRPARRDAPVVQSYRRWRLGGVTPRVVCGTRLAMEPMLTRWGWTITTAFVERLNLDIRPRVAASGRRGNTRGQGEAGVRAQVGLCQG